MSEPYPPVESGPLPQPQQWSKIMRAALAHTEDTEHRRQGLRYDGLSKGEAMPCWTLFCTERGCSGYLPPEYAAPVVWWQGAQERTAQTWQSKFFGYGGWLHRRGIKRRRDKGIWS